MSSKKLQVGNIDKSWDKVWDRLDDSYSILGGLDYDVQVKYNDKVLAPYEGKEIIEVGCGSGYFSLEMAKKGGKITLLDISPKALEVARTLFDKAKVKCKLILDDALKSSVKPNTFDIVWNGGVIEHFYDEGKIQLLTEMKKMTKPGGTVLVACPNKWDLPFFFMKKFADWRGNWPFGYEDLISPIKLRKLFSDSGMPGAKIFSFDPLTGWWFLPKTKKLFQLLGLEKEFFHGLKVPFGHVTYAVWIKPLNHKGVINE